MAIQSLAPGDGREGSECRSEHTGHDQSQHIIRMVDELLSSRSIPRSTLAAIAFEAGPGAFTSLRISCSVGQGLALGLGLPLIPVSTLEALALQAIGLARPGAYPVVVATDARMGEVYGASLVILVDEPGRPGRPVEVSDPRVGPAETLADWVDAGRFASDELVLVGDAFGTMAGLESSLHRAGMRTRRAVDPAQPLRAEAVAWIARELLAQRSDWDPADAAPRYVRDKVALDRDEQQRLRQARIQVSRHA